MRTQKARRSKNCCTHTHVLDTPRVLQARCGRMGGGAGGLREVMHSLQGAVESDVRRRRRNGCFGGRCADTHPRFLEPTYGTVALHPNHNTTQRGGSPRVRTRGSDPACSQAPAVVRSQRGNVGLWEPPRAGRREGTRANPPAPALGPTERLFDIPTSRTKKCLSVTRTVLCHYEPVETVVEVSIRCVGLVGGTFGFQAV
jgi:hypothetical protein